MLATGPAETIERIFGDVVTPLHGDLFDGVGHVLDGNLEVPLGHLFGGLWFAGGGLDIGGEA